MNRGIKVGALAAILASDAIAASAHEGDFDVIIIGDMHVPPVNPQIEALVERFLAGDELSLVDELLATGVLHARRMDGVTSTWLAEREAQREQAVDAILDKHRFQSADDEMLARHEDEDGFALFASADELRDRGVNVEMLADLLEAGMVDADSVGSLIRKNGSAVFNVALSYVRDIAQCNPLGGMYGFDDAPTARSLRS